MNTEIEYLKQLETDLKDAAARETARMERATLQGAIRKNTGRGWTKVVGVAAAFLVVAGAIGFLAQGGLMSSAGSGGQAFQEVGGAVADGGGETAARAKRRESDTHLRPTNGRRAPVRGADRPRRERGRP